jgi:hypothetical protein
MDALLEEYKAGVLPLAKLFEEVQQAADEQQQVTSLAG